jgi:hypothetical protein
MGVIDFLHGWTSRKLHERQLARWGMMRVCPWCGDWVERDGNHQMREAPNPFFDRFTCGCCGGESDWEFGPVPMYRGPGNSPKPDFNTKPKEGK